MKKRDEIVKKNEKNDIVIYTSEEGDIKIEIFLKDENLWLPQKRIAELFDVNVPAISKHLNNIYEEGELEKDATISILETVQTEGGREVKRNLEFYNLDAIIATGYRVNSKKATRFRIWATKILKDYIVKGFAMNDNQLKQSGGGNYWHELLERIRDIRSSEKIIYRQVLDLYSTSIDYNPQSAESLVFFKTVQNKLHYAVNEQTAAEIIYSRANAEKEFMGLTNFSGTLPTKKDISVAKNYLEKDELARLNRMVSAFFDLAEMRAMEHIEIKMSDWLAELDKFTSMYGKGTLHNAGKISHKKAIEKAEAEYRKYQVQTLSPVEKAYLNTIKKIQKEVEQK
jgi:hypothetical protein